MVTRQNRRRGLKRDLSDLSGLRVGLYCRVSLDKDQDAKSTTDQADEGRRWIASVGAVIAGEYIEEGSRSASRYATKEREEFQRLIADIKAGKLDAVWFWEQSRSGRRLDVFAELRNLCRDMGVLWVVRDRVYDPGDYKDMLAPGVMALLDESSSDQTSERVERGKASSAQAGRRAGKVPYGYRAVYDRDGTYQCDEPDRLDADGKPIKDSPAAVVREIYSRVWAGHSITSIRRDLDARGIRTAEGCKWANGTITRIASSPTYLGQRVYQAADHRAPADRIKTVLDGVEANWPALIDEETWWGAHRILTDPSRRKSRPGRGVHLLSSVAKCGVCGAGLVRKKANARGYMTYSCPDRVCVAIKAGPLDDYVEEIMVRWLSDPDVMADLTRGDDSAVASEARGEAEKLRAQLAELYRDVAAGQVSPTIATTMERGLAERVQAAEQLIREATLPPVLRANIGAQAWVGWRALDVSVKKQIVQTVALIRVHSVGRLGSQHVPVGARVSWRWLIGPNAGEEATDPDTAMREHRERHQAAMVERAQKAAELQTAGWTRKRIAEDLGVSEHTVKKILRQARELAGGQ